MTTYIRFLARLFLSALLFAAPLFVLAQTGPIGIVIMHGKGEEEVEAAVADLCGKGAKKVFVAGHCLPIP